MSGHKFEAERTNHGCYFADCSCGWSGGVFPSHGDAKRAHTAHVTGGPIPEPLKPQLLLSEPNRKGFTDTTTYYPPKSWKSQSTEGDPT